MHQDQDEDLPRLRSFTGPGTAEELSSKASKKKKRDPSPLSRMGSSLLRPFKGLSKLRTSRSSDRASRLQGQSRTGSYTDSLASRATSASTQDTAGPSRLNSASLQKQVQTLPGGKSALEPSDSFQFKRTATDDAPDLAAEPSFAQDLPHNSRSDQANHLQQAKGVVSSSRGNLATTTGMAGDTAGSSSLQLQQRGSAASAAAAAAAADSDDEFDYDLSQPAAPQRSQAAAASTAALLQPKVTSTSSEQPRATTSSDTGKADTDGSRTQEQMGANSDRTAQPAGLAGSANPTSFSVDAGNFRPQLSSTGKPQLAVATTSVYSPLESGAATSPTMQASADRANKAGALGAEDLPDEQVKSGRSSTVGSQQVSTRNTHGDSVQSQAGGADVTPIANASTTAAKEAERLQGMLQQDSSKNKAASQVALPATSQRGDLQDPSLTSQAFMGDDSPSPSLSSASSAASSEFDVLEVLPADKPSQEPPTVYRAGPSSIKSSVKSQLEPYTVQRSAYSDTPILGPAASQVRPPGLTLTAAPASSSKPALGTVFSQGLLQGGNGEPQMSGSALPSARPGQAAGSALPPSPRKGFSDKPLLAVYSRRPSADEEASQGSNNQSASEQALQNKVTHQIHGCVLLDYRISSTHSNAQCHADCHYSQMAGLNNLQVVLSLSRNSQ